jgi:hypothetical protein
LTRGSPDRSDMSCAAFQRHRAGHSRCN